MRFFNVPPVEAEEWTQEAHDAQRTGYTPEQPNTPWTFLWSWNGPDAQGRTSSHFYDIGTGAPYTGGGTTRRWEGRTVTGGDFIYAPALENGLYALRKTNGAIAWKYPSSGDLPSGDSMKLTPAYDPVSQTVLIGTNQGKLYKINATNGQLQGTYNASSPLNQSVLIVGGFVYLVTDNGELHKVNISSMTRSWVYFSGAQSGTPAAYSASKDILIYATKDLFVHAVNNNNGSRKWRTKPTPHSAAFPYEFSGYWPVVAEQHGIVFVRMRLRFDDLTGPSGVGTYFSSNTQNRDYLINNPDKKNLFALDLDTGLEKFVPAVGYCSVEAFVNGNHVPEIGPVPVVKVLPDGKEVAYEIFRNSQNGADGHTADGNMGEMVLDNNSVNGLVAGDLRFISWPGISHEHAPGGFIVDAVGPLTMAGNVLFHSQWGALESALITNRSSSLGINFSTPITTSYYPTVIRRIDEGGSANANHVASSSQLVLYGDGTPWIGPGFWVYWNVYDPPTPPWSVNPAYSEGITPRYTYAADGLVVVLGNGGELMVFRHSGSVPPPPTPTQGPTPSVKPGDLNHDGRVDISDLVIVGANFGKNTSSGDANGDGMVNINDLVIVGSNFGK